MPNAVATAGLLGARAEVLVAYAHVSNIAGRPIFTSVTETEGAPTAERVMGAIAATGMCLPALRTEVTRNLASAQSTPPRTTSPMPWRSLKHTASST